MTVDENACPFCKSVHDPDAYAVGYFVVDAKVVAVTGEGAALEYGRETGLPIYWEKPFAQLVVDHGDEELARHEEAQQTLNLTAEDYRAYTLGQLGPMTYGEQVAWFADRAKADR